MENSAIRVYRHLWGLLDWVYPPSCGGCSQPGNSWCPDCDALLEKITSPVCEICGEKLTASDPKCLRCISHPPNFSRLRSYAYFQSPLREAIHRFKYQRDIGLGIVFANFLYQIFTAQDWQVDLVVPVPLSKARIKQRGYNQAAVIAYPLSLTLGRPYRSKALTRIRETRSQVGLSIQERFLNVENAFASDTPTVSGKSILLVDDVTTTGSTLNACASALFVHDAKRVYCLTVARARNPKEDLPHANAFAG
jgi:ComF family protein